MIEAVVAAITPLVLIVSGSNPTPIVAGQTPPTWLDGQFTNGDNVEMVPYPAGYFPVEGKSEVGPSTAIGVTNTLAMQNAALAAGTPLTIMGTSQGALVIDQVITDDIAAGVRPNALSFVIIEDPNRGSGILTFVRGITVPILDYKPIPIPDSPYNTTVVTAEYDGVADFPTNPLNVLADINAVIGLNYLHVPSVYSDLSTVPAANITKTTDSAGGVTTTYLVPTAELPIAKELGQLGLPAPIVSFVNRLLRPVIDSAYAGRLKMDAEDAAASVPADNATAATAVTAAKAADIKTVARSLRVRVS